MQAKVTCPQCSPASGTRTPACSHIVGTGSDCCSSYNCCSNLSLSPQYDCRGADGGERGDGQQCGDTDICLQSPACRGVVGRADQAGRASLGVHNHLPAVIMCGGFNRQAGHL